MLSIKLPDLLDFKILNLSAFLRTMMLMTLYFAGLQNYNLFKVFRFFGSIHRKHKKCLALNILPTNIQWICPCL